LNDLDCLYEAYLATPEGFRISNILTKLDKYCQAWMHKDDVQKLKKELLVQILDSGYVLTEESEPYYQI
jgi:hypothetical protein